MATREQQANTFLQGKQLDERDTTARSFLIGNEYDPSADQFLTSQELLAEAIDEIQDPRVKAQKATLAFGQVPLHTSAQVFTGYSIDPRDTSALDFIGSYGE